MNKKPSATVPVGKKMVISIRRPGKNELSANNIGGSQKSSKTSEQNRMKAWDPKQYRFKYLIYESGSVRIYQADHISTNHKVAIKTINLDNEEFLESVLQEINTLAKLRHPNILPMWASFVKDNYLWNVIPNAEYGSADLWSKPNGLPELAIAFVIKDVLTALSYLHKKGIIHRAVCGSHILINTNGNCMLTGLKYSTSVLQKGRWQPNIHQYPKNSVHLLNYMAPEILEQNLLGYNSKSDIYSVGIVCCELANGCIPFEDIVSTEMLLDKLTGNFPRPLDSTCEEIQNFPTNNPDLSPEVQEKYNLYKNRTFSQSFHIFTIQHCLNFDSCSRPTASDLLNNNFIKQTKKSHRNLIEILQNHTKTSRNNNVIYRQQTTSSYTGTVPTNPETLNTKMDRMNLGSDNANNDDIEWIF